MWRQLVAFISACSVGAVVNYWVTLWTHPFTPIPQIAAIFGVVAGTVFNFLASRYWVFRLKHYTEKAREAAPPINAKEANEGFSLVRSLPHG